MGLNEDLEEGRAEAESRMSETVSVGEVVEATDPVTGDPVETIATPIYSGKGRVKYGSLTVADRVGPSQPLSVQTPSLGVPHGSPLLHEGMTVIVTGSTVDALLENRRFTIDGKPQSGQTTSHRYPLKEAS